MFRAAVMGDRDSIYGFAAIGLDIHPVEDAAQAGRQLRALAEGGCAVIYVTEALCPHIQAEMALYAERRLPAIIPIPGATGNTGLGRARVKKFIEQAVGSDILFDNP
jgi:V/A-type H+-transporting ATPase subunit F